MKASKSSCLTRMALLTRIAGSCPKLTSRYTVARHTLRASATWGAVSNRPPPPSTARSVGLGPTGVPRGAVQGHPMRPPRAAPMPLAPVSSMGWTLADAIDSARAPSGAKGHRLLGPGVTAAVKEMLLSTVTEVMLRQCCARPFNRAKPNSSSPNYKQLESKHSENLASNYWDSLGPLGLVSIFES